MLNIMIIHFWFVYYQKIYLIFYSLCILQLKFLHVLQFKASTNTALKTFLLLDETDVVHPAVYSEQSACLDIGSSLQIPQLHYVFVSLR